MESPVKTWLFGLLVVVPIMCLVISVVLWKHTHNETFDIQKVKRELKADIVSEIQNLQSEYSRHTINNRRESDEVQLQQQQQLRNEVDNLHTQKRTIQSQIESDKVQLQQQHQQRQQMRTEVDDLHTEKREVQSLIKRNQVKLNRKLKTVLGTLSSIKKEKRQCIPGNNELQAHRYHGYGHTTPATGGGAVYVHWGREDCPSTADLVYTGMAGGGHYGQTGAGVNMVCMTNSPVWAKYGSNANYYTSIYGAEYEVHAHDFPLGHDRAQKLHDHDVPCTVCRSSTRTSAIMIPGTTKCTPGWQIEYWGYIMAGYHTHSAATEYNCINSNPDAHEAGTLNDNGRLLYRVKAACGSLHCPPYVNKREITCVVCTK